MSFLADFSFNTVYLILMDCLVFFFPFVSRFVFVCLPVW